ncbi:MAG: 2OG-Fe(II) oxygenase [Gloeomargaritaceae cyanobacterium C42_A2020_066]|nr:2OG-Fe(II) oxygenase [Gloeomargaritaceae cyanobacterium C42_A2020_066]
MPALAIGDPAPWFTAPTPTNPAFHFDTVGGHRVILCFFGSAQPEAMRALLQGFAQRRGELAGRQTVFFGITINPQDRNLVMPISSYFQLVWDFEAQVSQRYGVYQAQSGRPGVFRPTIFVLNERLQVVALLPIQPDCDHVNQVFDHLDRMPSFSEGRPAEPQAPVLFIPHVLEPDFCEALIQHYEAVGGQPSGFMRQKDGQTVGVMDLTFKRRSDVLIQEQPLLQQINDRILCRVKPEIEKGFQFTISRFERHLVACYTAAEQGFFNRHRDNTTAGTAHRRFAMSLNLNTGDYTGGHLRFPEFGSHLYSPQRGEALIFSCSLLHEATSVTAGRRYALLSFFYDDAGAAVRAENRRFLVQSPQSAPEAEDKTKG